MTASNRSLRESRQRMWLRDHERVWPAACTSCVIMNVKRWFLVGVPALALLLGSCGSGMREVRVETTGATEAPPGGINARTYAIGAIEQAPPQYQSPPRSQEATRRMRPLIEEALRARGYQPAASIADADIVIMYAAGSRVKEKPPQRSTRNSDMWSAEDEQFVEGAITIDALDGKTGKRVWHGVGRTEIDPDKTDDVLLRKGVNKVLEKFPLPGQ
jgi:hypothetical protein